jgi:hypothetical protein
VYSCLLIDEPPLQVLPTLAVMIGLEEAIVLQQIHYWIQRSDHIRDGRRWVFNSYADWKAQIPFMSMRTLERVFASLEKPYTPKRDNDPLPPRPALLLSCQMDKSFNRTKWYTIHYEALQSLESGDRTRQSGGIRTRQSGGINNANLAGSTCTESTSENTRREMAPEPPNAGMAAAKLPGEKKPTAAQELFETICVEVQYRPTARQMTERWCSACATMLREGFTAEQVLGCTRWMLRDRFWRTKNITPDAIHKQLPGYLRGRRETVEGPASPEPAKKKAPSHYEELMTAWEETCALIDAENGERYFEHCQRHGNDEGFVPTPRPPCPV